MGRVCQLLGCAALASLLLLTAPPGRAAALPGGMPLMARYTANDYPGAPANFAVVGDPRGMVWAGNSEGLLRFAGGRWELIELPGRSPARAMAIGPDGALYVGGYDRIGRVEELPSGEVAYVDLHGRFEGVPKGEAVGNVWDVLSTPDGVWFRAEQRMFWLGADGATRSWPLPDTLRGVHAIGREIYGRIQGRGLTRFRNGEFEALPGGEHFAARSFNAAFAAEGEELLVLSADGFFRADARGITPVPTAHDALLRERRPYTALRLPDGGYAVGTNTGHVLHFGPTLALVGDYAIDPYAVIAMGLDREGGVWVATEGGLVRLSMPSPWTMFGAADGLSGQYADATWFDGALYVAGTAGLFRAEGAGPESSKFVRRDAPNAEVWDLELTPAGLLVGARDGAYLEHGGKITRISDAADVYWIRRSLHRPDEAYAITELSLIHI